MKSIRHLSLASLALFTSAMSLAAVSPAAAAIVNLVEVHSDGNGGFDALDGARGIAVSPDGKHVYLAADKENAVSVYDRDPSTGAMTQIQVLRDGEDGGPGLAGARGVTLSGDGLFVYVAAGVDDALTVFSRDPATGLLSFVQVVEDNAAGVNGLDGAASIAITSDGTSLYVAGSVDKAVSVYRGNPVTGLVSFQEIHREGVAGVTGTDHARTVAISPDGQNVYSAGSAYDSIAVFRRDASTGSLMFVEVQHDGAGGVDGLDGARGVAVSPDGLNLYVTGSIDDKMAVFRRDPATGALTFLAVYKDDDGEIDGLNGGWAVTVSGDGTRVYVVANVDDALAVFRRDPATGLLTFLEVRRNGIGGVSGLNGARAVAVSPDGASIYVCGFVSDAVAVFKNNDPCGNGIIDPGEECDDGNRVAADCCSATCHFDPAGASCDDEGNTCTTDQCNGQGVCLHTARTGPCHAGAFCTVNATCQGGVCQGTARDCSASSDQCNDGACDETADACVPRAKANGTACNDANACTQVDSCQAGVCTGTSPVVCAGPDQCHDAGTCDPATGTCSYAARADGTACNDGNACTQTDSCQAGTCTGQNPVVCAAQDQCHKVGTCNTATGTCSNPNKPNGASCDDGNPCTQTDSCQAGACTGQNPIVCTAQDSCHIAGTCNSATGTCSNPVKADGATCNDGNACTQTDTCQAGTCTGTNPVVCTAQDQCHDVGICNSTTGTCSNPNKPNGSACSDGNACTQADSCQAGVCTGANPVVCTAQDQCHTPGTCNPATGVCSSPAKANGIACSDGNGCTQNDTCQAGICTGGTPMVCNAPDQCHTAGTCSSATGTCSYPAKADGTTCNDGNACTRTDSCQAGTCTGTNPVVCTAEDQCHAAGTCNSATGTCANPAKPNGTSCSDGNACTQTDTCEAGTCTGQNPVVCTAEDQCHAAGTCDSATGTCSNPEKANDTPCDDGN